MNKPVEKIQETAQAAAKSEAVPPRVRNYRAILFQVGLICVGFAFAVLTFFVKSTNYFPIDLKITRTLQTINDPIFSESMRAISWPGFFPQSVVITLIIIGLFYFYGFYWEALMCVIAWALVMGVDALVKIAIHRVRPEASLVHVVTTLSSYSFPSGHVMFYTGFLGFILFLIYSLFKRSMFRSLLFTLIGVLILFVGMSRVFLGEHWTSDVVGAYLLAILTLALTIQIYRWGKHHFFIRQPAAGEHE